MARGEYDRGPSKVFGWEKVIELYISDHLIWFDKDNYIKLAHPEIVKQFPNLENTHVVIWRGRSTELYWTSVFDGAIHLMQLLK